MQRLPIIAVWMVVIILAGGCGRNLIIRSVTINPLGPDTFSTQCTVDLSVSTIPADTQVRWLTGNGTLSSVNERKVLWTPPSEPGVYAVTVTAMKDNDSLSATAVYCFVQTPVTVTQHILVNNEQSEDIFLSVGLRNNSNYVVTDVLLKAFLWDKNGKRMQWIPHSYPYDYFLFNVRNISLSPGAGQIFILAVPHDANQVLVWVEEFSGQGMYWGLAWQECKPL